MKEKRKENDDDSLIELLSNEGFKKWVLEPNYESDLFWHTWLENNPDKQELVNAAREFIRSAQFREISFSQSEKDEVLSNIIQDNWSKNSVPKALFGDKVERKPIAPSIYKVAAVFLLLLTFSGWAWWDYMERKNAGTEESKLVQTVKENAKGKKSVFTLPDGTKVILNAASKLSYGQDYGQTERTVTLTGEAFFEVVKNPGAPFHVISGKVKTTALGTSFNISAFENDGPIKVSLLTGKVKVAKLDDAEGIGSQGNILAPGEGFLIPKGNGEMERVKVDPLLDFAWKDGVLVFQGSSMTEVTQALERWYGVEIKVMGQPKKPWKVDGTFENERLERILRGLGFTYDMEYTIKGKEVELKFK